MAGQNVPILRKITRHYGLQNSSGILIVTMDDKGPAWSAGLREGDIIYSFAGEKVEGIDELHRLLTEEWVDNSAQVCVIRGTHRLDMEVTPREREFVN